MNTCEHRKHPVVTLLIYVVTGLALFLHVLSHMLPIVILMHSKWLEMVIEHPITTVVALLFIPLSIYHLWRDNQMHETIHRLMKERDEAIKEVFRLKREMSPERTVISSRKPFERKDGAIAEYQSTERFFRLRN